MNNDYLKKCPFCGTYNACAVNEHVDVTHYYVVECLCGARGPQVPFRPKRQNSSDPEWIEAESRAIRAWNKRFSDL